MSVRPRRLSKKKVTILLQSSDCTLDTRLTNQVPPNVFISEVHTCSDGSVVEVLNDGFGNRYSTHQDWLISLSKLKALVEQSEPFHILKGRLPHGQQFADACVEIAMRLHNYFDVDPEILNNSLESLSELDRAVQKKDKSECLSPPVFESLLAYIGEVIKNVKKDAYWEMRKLHNNSEDIWEPFLVISNQGHPIFIDLYDELYEAKKVSTRSLAESFI